VFVLGGGGGGGWGVGAIDTLQGSQLGILPCICLHPFIAARLTCMARPAGTPRS